MLFPAEDQINIRGNYAGTDGDLVLLGELMGGTRGESVGVEVDREFPDLFFVDLDAEARAGGDGKFAVLR